MMRKGRVYVPVRWFWAWVIASFGFAVAAILNLVFLAMTL